MTPEIVGFALLVLVASAVQGFLGFGYGVIVMSVMTLSSDLVHATAFVNLSSLALSLAMVSREYRRILWKAVLWILPAMAAGIGVGLVALRRVDRELMVPLLGMLIVAIAIWNIVAPTLRRRDSRLLDLAFGGVAGVLSGAFNTGGPPLVVHLYRRPEAPITLVITLQAIFVGNGIVRAVMATAQDLMPLDAALQALYSLPVVVAGTLVGMAAANRTQPARFRRAAWLGLGCLGAALVLWD
jgi:uncharacterized membrane protein YfcA